MIARNLNVSNFGAFTDWLFAAALFGGMAREGIHLAETTVMKSDFGGSIEGTEAGEEDSLVSISHEFDFSDMVNRIFLQGSIWQRDGKHDGTARVDRIGNININRNDAVTWAEVLHGIC
jgi:hypothetical protein